MLTKNWYKGIAAAAVGAKDTAVDEKGTTRSLYSGGFAFNMNNTISTSQGIASYVRIGTGTTPPTPDDYNLSGTQITKISSTYTDQGTTVENGVATKTVIYTVTNTDTTDITIGEIALFSGMKYSSSSTAAFMFDRTVLDTPVTIPAGGIGQVTYTIRFNYPTA